MTAKAGDAPTEGPAVTQTDVPLVWAAASSRFEVLAHRERASFVLRPPIAGHFVARSADPICPYDVRGLLTHAAHMLPDDGREVAATEVASQSKEVAGMRNSTSMTAVDRRSSSAARRRRNLLAGALSVFQLNPSRPEPLTVEESLRQAVAEIADAAASVSRRRS